MIQVSPLLDIQAQDRVFDRVQKHLHSQLALHGLTLPGAHLHLLNDCLNRLGMQTQISGCIWTVHTEGWGVSYEGFVLAIEFPGGHIISRDNERGWEVIQSNYFAWMNSTSARCSPEGRWEPLTQEQIACTVMPKRTDLVSDDEAFLVVSQVTAFIEQEFLQETTPALPLNASGGRL